MKKYGLLVIVFLFLLNGCGHDTENKESTSEIIEESNTESTETIVQENASEVDSDTAEKISVLVQGYIDNYFKGNVDELVNYASPVTDTMSDNSNKVSKYVKSYDNFTILLQKGVDNQEYMAFVSFDINLYESTDVFPNYEYYYIRTDNDGKLFIDSNWIISHPLNPDNEHIVVNPNYLELYTSQYGEIITYEQVYGKTPEDEGVALGEWIFSDTNITKLIEETYNTQVNISVNDPNIANFVELYFGYEDSIDNNNQIDSSMLDYSDDDYISFVKNSDIPEYYDLKYDMLINHNYHTTIWNFYIDDAGELIVKLNAYSYEDDDEEVYITFKIENPPISEDDDFYNSSVKVTSIEVGGRNLPETEFESYWKEQVSYLEADFGNDYGGDGGYEEEDDDE